MATRDQLARVHSPTYLDQVPRFELKGGVEEAQQFISNTTLTISAPSLGGVETLITRPVTTSHSGLSAEDRQRLGISDRLIRLSVGIEATDDLIQDFSRALGS